MNLMREMESIEHAAKTHTEEEEQEEVETRILRLKLTCLEKIRKRDFKENEFYQCFFIINRLSRMTKKGKKTEVLKAREEKFFFCFNKEIEPIFRAEFLDDELMLPILKEILSYFTIYSPMFPEITIEFPHSLALSMTLLRLLAADEDEIEETLKKKGLAKMIELGTTLFKKFTEIRFAAFDIDWSPTLAGAALIGLNNSLKYLIKMEMNKTYDNLIRIIANTVQYINTNEAFFQEKIISIIRYYSQTIKAKEEYRFPSIKREKKAKMILKQFHRIAKLIKALCKANFMLLIEALIHEKPSWRSFSILSIILHYSGYAEIMKAKEDFKISNYIEQSKKYYSSDAYGVMLDYVEIQNNRKKLKCIKQNKK